METLIQFPIDLIQIDGDGEFFNWQEEFDDRVSEEIPMRIRS